ncbi:hypothetical protein FTV93_13870 [Escherichia coli]|uniref:Uncharacterized protein n=1 Tax=Escherichia coli TaxID=562 RepID=A0A5B9ALB0_ECOLX|nr:hypothetical protein FTV93_13870 [Escherichia coli]
MAINNTGSRRLLVTLTALFAALCGLYLLIGGGWLVAIGGSSVLPYRWPCDARRRTGCCGAVNAPRFGYTPPCCSAP